MQFGCLAALGWCSPTLRLLRCCTEFPGSGIARLHCAETLPCFVPAAQLYWINPMSYTLYSLIVGQLGDVDQVMQTTGTTDSEVRELQMLTKGCAWIT